MAKSKNKYYVVWVGQNPGIYKTWAECKAQTAGFPNAKYKAFKTLSEAEEAFGESATRHIEKKSISKNKEKPLLDDVLNLIDKNSISVDAACARNPGIMEYRGVHTVSKEEIFRMGPFKNGTNNVGEFLALVHALAMLKKKGDTKTAIYTDSRTGLSWLKNKRVKTTLKKTKDNAIIFELLDRALKWVKNNKIENKIIKWDTKNWGEIPADFGVNSYFFGANFMR